MEYVVTAVHVIAALFLVLVVLLQSGRAGGMGAAFGGGGGNNVFGARGAGNLLTKLTGASAVIFFLTSFTLSIMSSKTGSVVQGVGSSTPTAASAPAAAAPLEAAPSEAAPSEAAAPAEAAPAPGDAAQKPQE